jgi:phage tail-like protein
MPSFNTDFLYSHLPARYRREDKELFLKRFLQFSGVTLDSWDEMFERFYENIQPATAPESWIEFWLDALFGWSYFPKGFTLEQKRTLYGNFAGHLARRGTPKGIELWLKDFGITSRVYARAEYWDEFYFAEDSWMMEIPLVTIIEIYAGYSLTSYDLGTFDDCIIEDTLIFGINEQIVTNVEIESLLRYVQPFGQAFYVTFSVAPAGLTPDQPETSNSTGLIDLDGNGLLDNNGNGLII